MTSRPVLLTVDEVAEEFQVHPETVREWARTGRIAAIKVPPGGHLVRFRREDIDEMLKPVSGPAVGDAA